MKWYVFETVRTLGTIGDFFSTAWITPSPQIDIREGYNFWPPPIFKETRTQSKNGNETT